MSVHHQREVTSGNGKASMGSPIEIEARSWLAIFVDHSGSKKRDMNEYVMIVMIYPLKRPLNNGGTYDSPMDLGVSELFLTQVSDLPSMLKPERNLAEGQGDIPAHHYFGHVYYSIL